MPALTLGSVVPESGPVAEPETAILTFLCSGVLYGFPLAAVREILRYQPPTPVPLMPAFVLGVTNVRGQVLPVVDLAARLGHPGTADGKRTCTIVLEIPYEDRHVPLGVRVDEMLAVSDVPDARIGPVPAFGAGIRPEFMLGVIMETAGCLVLLSPEAVLSLEELAALADAPVPS